MTVTKQETSKNQKRPNIKNVKRPGMLQNEKFENQEVQQGLFTNKKKRKMQQIRKNYLLLNSSRSKLHLNK
jgi:hypothetical protein